MRLSVVSAIDGSEYASTIVEAADWKTAAEQQLNVITIPFVSGSADRVKLMITNAGAAGTTPVLDIGLANLYRLGPASFTWTRFPRAVVRLIQRLFITAVMLPLTLIGAALLLMNKKRRALAILLVIPAYYMIFQSALHTEYRYVLAVQYFLLVFVAAAIHRASEFLWSAATRRRFRKR